MGLHFNVAKQAAKNAEAANSVHGNALIAVVFSVVSLEAFINEAIETAVASRADLESDPAKGAAFGEMGKQIEEFHGSLELKYQVAKWIFSGSAFDKAANPYQDFVIFIATRNALIHFKLLDKYEMTATGMELKTPIPILDRLRSKHVLSESPANVGVLWLQKIGTEPMAARSCEVAKSMVKELAAIPPRGIFKTQMELLVKGFEIE